MNNQTQEWQFVPPEAMTLLEYPCGVHAGMILRLSRQLKRAKHEGSPTGGVRCVGEEAMVMTGNPAEPEVVWIRWKNAPQSETWDRPVSEWFEVVGEIPWPESRLSSKLWWSSRRKAYNIGLAAAGVLAFLAYAAVCFSIKAKPGQEPPEMTLFTTLFHGLGYLVMMGVANLCYGLGPAVERVVPQAKVVVYRTVAFRAGFVFSVALPFVIPLLTWLANR